MIPSRNRTGYHYGGQHRFESLISRFVLQTRCVPPPKAGERYTLNRPSGFLAPGTAKSSDAKGLEVGIACLHASLSAPRNNPGVRSCSREVFDRK